MDQHYHKKYELKNKKINFLHPKNMNNRNMIDFLGNCSLEKLILLPLYPVKTSKLGITLFAEIYR